MMKGKYVMVEDTYPVLIPMAMSHDRIANLNITSAGFFKIYRQDCGKLDVCAYGKSESLGLECDVRDAAVIKAFMQINGEPL